LWAKGLRVDYDRKKGCRGGPKKVKKSEIFGSELAAKLGGMGLRGAVLLPKFLAAGQ
jgi:hypothetical protein